MIFLRFPSVILIISVTIFLTLSTPEINAAAANTPTPSADTQNAEDQFLIGRAYYRGEGATQSYEQAGFWYRKAAEQGNLKAMYNLGIMFLEGQGTKKDEAQGYHWIRKAAESGDPRATYLCGVLLCEGIGVSRDKTEGVSWLHQAAKSGDPNAIARLGQDYFYGEDGVTKDPAMALPLIQSAAEKRNPWACGTLGEMLLTGDLLPKNQVAATALFQQGAVLGNPTSQFEYARILMSTDPVRAYPWIKLAVEAHEIRAIGLMNDCRPHLTPEQVASGDAEAVNIRKNYLHSPTNK
jgi:hypothetical protein